MILMGDINDNTYSAKYMIVDKKLLIPNPISYTFEREPIDILTQLNNLQLSNNPTRKKAKEEILDYLSRIGFPRRGVYTD
jgi:hypothetical protein